MALSRIRLDLTGRRFGRLTVLDHLERRYGDGSVLWRSRCDCGGENISPAKVLMRGDTRSCGCLLKESRYGRQQTHGYSATAHYRRWRNLLNRCQNPHVKSYKDYGARGIRVCERWQRFENFLADMGDPPPSMEIERIDNDGDYSPENCRWATRVENARNKRTTVMLTLHGVTKPLATWAAERGMRRATLYARVHSGWPTARALEK